MRALRFHPPESLVVETSAPIPTPSPTQYLIRVHATAITANELKWSETLQRSSPIPGHDVCGTIVSCPPHVSPQFNVGEEVIALTCFSRDGAAAEYVLAEAKEIAPKPKSLSSRDAAAIPLSALTAWQALVLHGGLKRNSGMSVLVLGAAGGVGVMAVQLARWHRAQRITGTCSERNVEFVKDLGATDIVDYSKMDVQGRFDVVLDCVGGKTQDGCWKNVEEGGILVSVATPLPEEKKGEYPEVKSIYFIVKPDGSRLGMLNELFESGDLRAFVDTEFLLEEGGLAFGLLAKCHARGKIVLTL